MQVREATSEDLATFLEHIWSLKELEESLGFTGYEQDEKFVKEASKYLILALDRSDYYMYVAEEEGRVVGTLIGCIEPTETFYRHDLLGCIRFIFIDPDSRDQNVGKMLVERFEEEMRKTGVGAVYASIHQANTLPQFKLLHHGWSYQFIQLFREI